VYFCLLFSESCIVLLIDVSVTSVADGPNNAAVLTTEMQEKIQKAVSVYKDVQKTLMEGTIAIERFELINKNKANFLAIQEVIEDTKTRDETKIDVVLQWRAQEVREFDRQWQDASGFLEMCRNIKTGYPFIIKSRNKIVVFYLND
jgi:mevalonate kinase